MTDPTAIAASSCFSTCDCVCRQGYEAFDRVARIELRDPPKLHDICHGEIGWFSAREFVDNETIELKGLPRRSGVYILWHKDEYCPTHEMFHMKALYVGKGNQATRLRAHWQTRDFSKEMLVYYSFYPTTNRIAKYIEQLLLDTYRLPLNTAENVGTARLCAHFSQWEVD